MREIKKVSSTRAAMNSENLQKRAASLLHKSVLQLCKESVQFGTQLHVMGVLCMTIDDESSDIVVKVNETFRKEDLEVDESTPTGHSPQKENLPICGLSASSGPKQSFAGPPARTEQLTTTGTKPFADAHAASGSRSDSVSECGFSTCSSSADCAPHASGATKHSKRKRSPKKFLLQNWVEKQQRQAAASASNAQTKSSTTDFDALADAIRRRAQQGQSSAQPAAQAPPRAEPASSATPKKGESAPSEGHSQAELSAPMNGFVPPPTIVGLVPFRNVAQQFVSNGMQMQHLASLNGYAHAQAALQNAAHQQLAALHSAQLNALQNLGSQQAHSMRAAYLDLPPGCTMPYFVSMRDASHCPAPAPASASDAPSDLRVHNNRVAAADLSVLTGTRAALLAAEHTHAPGRSAESPIKHSEGLLKQCDIPRRPAPASVPNSPLKAAEDLRRRGEQPSILALAEAAEFVQRQADCEPHAVNASAYLRDSAVVSSPPSAVPKWSSPPRVSQSDSVGNHSDEQPVSDPASHFENDPAAGTQATHATVEFTVDFEADDDADSQRNATQPKSAARKRIAARNRPASGSGTDSVGAPSTGRRKRISSSFKCNQCNQAFATLGELTQHTVADHGAYKCTVCSLHFTQRSNLQRHSLRHVGFKPYQCSLCGIEYYRKDHLIRHVSTVHSGADARSAVIERLSSSECLMFLERMRNDSHSESVKSAAAVDDDDVADVAGQEDDGKVQEVVFADEHDGEPLHSASVDAKPGLGDALLRVVSPVGAQFEDVSDDEHEEHAEDESLKATRVELTIAADECAPEGDSDSPGGKKHRPDSALSAQEECTVNVRECLANGTLADSK